MIGDPLPNALSGLRLPAIAAPLFIISTPDLVIAQCKAGVIGSFPALNARQKDGEQNMLEIWLQQITEELDRYNQANPDALAAPFAVNQIVHRGLGEAVEGATHHVQAMRAASSRWRRLQRRGARQKSTPPPPGAPGRRTPPRSRTSRLGGSPARQQKTP